MIIRFSVAALLITAISAQTPALRKGVSVRMAVTANAVAVPDADQHASLVVTVVHDGSAFLNISRETPERLKVRIAAQPGKQIYLKGDARTPYSNVMNVLEVLRTVGVGAPILLTSQDNPTRGSYAPPMGLKVILRAPPDTARAVNLGTGDRQVSDAELTPQARQNGPILLEPDAMTPFGDVVHAVDVFRGEGAEVFLSMQTQ